MHLLIAREAVDAHLSVAGDIIDPDADLGRKAKAGARGRRLLRPLAADARRRPRPGARRRTPSSARSPGTCATSSGPSRKLARSTFYGMSRWQGKLERKQAFLGRIVDIGAELFAMSAVCVRARAERDDPPRGRGAGRPVLPPGAAAGGARSSPRLWSNTDARRRRAGREAVLAGRYASLEEGIVPPPDDGDWVATWSPARPPRRTSAAASRRLTARCSRTLPDRGSSAVRRSR